ncbi:hypothetical protein GCM10009740_12520 [Terrabacter terrae]|uniref:Uncharacterized protein n=1 Tax=Terrabacter terrae TaxID=318434 RepID=A0ABN2TYU1_9MICO
MSDRAVALVTQGEEAARELPMPVIAYFLITFALFLVALAVTWSFRNTAYKVQAPRPTRPAEAAHQGSQGVTREGTSGSGGAHH